MAQLTLVVPTYNRPAALRRLLRFLSRSDSPFGIVVLDSSVGELAEQNRATCEATGSVSHHTFDSDIPFYQKLSDGLSAHVNSPAVCLCADDDFVLPRNLARAADALLSDATISVAHGYFAQFEAVTRPRVLRLLSTFGTINADRAIDRVAMGLMNYDATIYSVHRTDVMHHVLKDAGAAPSLFAGEICTSTTACSYGSVVRLPYFTHARSTSPSHPAKRWHPAEITASEPSHLFEAFDYIQGRVERHIGKLQHRDRELFVLAAMTYVSDHMSAASLRRLTNAMMTGTDQDELRQLGMSEFAGQLVGGGLRGKLRSSRAGEWLRRKLHNHTFAKTLVLRAMRNTTERPVVFSVDTGAKIVLERRFREQCVSVRVADPAISDLCEAIALHASITQ